MQFSPYQPPANEGLDIVFEDSSFLIVNKQSGLLTTPGRGEDKQDCLVSRIRLEYPTAEAIHRLDMATSGLVIIALNKQVHRDMSMLFQNRQVHKRYIAIVEGMVNDEKGVIDLPMITDWPNRPLQMIDHELGKAAITHYKVLERNEALDCSRVELEPKTGRTHQLRLHMQAIGHPVKGDNLYSNNVPAERNSRLLLHAESLEFTHPETGNNIQVVSPADF